MTKKMTAAVRDMDGNTTTITSDYSNKKAFRDDMNANGYTVIGSVMVEGEENRAQETGKTSREYAIDRKYEN